MAKKKKTDLIENENVAMKVDEIKFVDVDKLIPNPRNNNSHSQEQIDYLCKIIKVHGFRNPLTVSNRSGFLVAGHLRLECAKILGIKTVPVMFQDFISEAEEYQCLTADNEIARLAVLDYEKLNIALTEIPDIDTSMLGILDFKLPEIEMLPPQGEDEGPGELPLQPKTRRGDVWLLGAYYECEACKKKYEFKEGRDLKECACDEKK